jgi:hypothetical protein
LIRDTGAGQFISKERWVHEWQHLHYCAHTHSCQQCVTWQGAVVTNAGELLAAEAAETVLLPSAATAGMPAQE